MEKKSDHKIDDISNIVNEEDTIKKNLRERYSEWRRQNWKTKTLGTLAEFMGVSAATLAAYAIGTEIYCLIENAPFIETFKNQLLPIIDENHSLSNVALSVVNMNMIYGIVAKLIPYLERIGKHNVDSTLIKYLS